MGIARFFNKTVVVRRLKSGGGYKKRFHATATADCSIQRMGTHQAEQLGILDRKGWLAFFDQDTTIAEGDLVRDSLSNQEYRVVEVVDHDFGINQHLMVTLEETNE